MKEITGTAEALSAKLTRLSIDLHRPAHGETVVPGKDPLRIQFAGARELRVLSAWRPDDLS